MKNKFIEIWNIIIGKCQMCDKWFCYKEKHLGTRYVDNSKNYAKVCDVCHEEICTEIQSQFIDMHL
jgi:hypothetical protein